MRQFQLKIVTPDGLRYDGPAEEITVRTTEGEMGILAGHINCVAPLGMGRSMMVLDGKKRYAACIGGMITVVDGTVTLVPTTFEWADDIDAARAQASLDRAQKVLDNKDNVTETDLKLAEARLHRALVRKNVASFK